MMLFFSGAGRIMAADQTARKASNAQNAANQPGAKLTQWIPLLILHGIFQGIAENRQYAENTKNLAEHVVEYTSTQIRTNGWMYYLSATLSILSVGVGMYAGYTMYSVGLYILNFFQDLPGIIYRFVMFFVFFFYNYIWYPLTKKPETT
jgi:hypothetical protein